MPLPLIIGAAASALGKVFIDKAPDVATWIFGDKSGKTVETVTGIAREILGVDDVGSIEAAIARDPQAALQFRMAVMAAREQERQAELATLHAQLADVQNARHQTVELARVGSPLQWGAAIISSIVTLGFFGMLYLILRNEVPEGSQRIADIMMGGLGTSFSAVVGYWVGSSAGSASKDAALRAAAAAR